MSRSLSIVLGLLAAAALVEVGLPLLLYSLRDGMMFFPSQHPGPEAGLDSLRGLTQVDLVWIRRPDGRELAAYDARPMDEAARDAPVILFFHGNAGNIAHRALMIETFAAMTGVRTLLFDYSGFGGNPGTPSERAAYEDGTAAWDHLAAEGVPAERIVLYGESLGAAVAIEVARRRGAAGLIAQSSFSSAASLCRRHYPWLPLTSVLARGTFPSADRLPKLTTPLLVVHGDRDEIIPLAEGKKLHRAAAEGTELLVVPGAGHNDLIAVAGLEYLRAVGARAREWAGRAGG